MEIAGEALFFIETSPPIYYDRVIRPTIFRPASSGNHLLRTSRRRIEFKGFFRFLVFQIFVSEKQ
jgi:hypothetical protein